MRDDERDRPLGRDQHCLQGRIAAAVDVHRRARAEGEVARRGGDALARCHRDERCEKWTVGRGLEKESRRSTSMKYN